MRDLDDLLLKKQTPVGCVVGMYYLPYMPKEYRFHFNGHNICIIGKDEQAETYTVLDSNATQKVTLRALNLRMTEDAAALQVNGILEGMVAALPQSEVYDPDGGYLTSFTDAVYGEALTQALQQTDTLCTESSLELHLKYTDGAWKIVADRALMTALTGGES